MYREGKRFYISEEEMADSTLTRKQLCLPKRSSLDDADDKSLSNMWTEMCGEWEFADKETVPSERMTFSRLVADIRREEAAEKCKQKARDREVDTTGTVVFDMNQPYVTACDADEKQMDAKAFIHMVERLIRRYRHRWGIENGFKKLKHSIVRTTSTEYDYRFFNGCICVRPL